jgi:hypothetical protein
MARQRTIEAVAEELSAARLERREFTRANPGPFPETCAENVESFVEACKARFEALATDVAVHSGHVDSDHSRMLALAAVLSSEDTADRLRLVAKRFGAGLKGLSKTEVERRVAGFDEQIGKLERELRELEKAAALAEVEAQFAEVGR